MDYRAFMPTIAFASSKGGCGKSTAAVLLASALAGRSAVTIIDADPNQPIIRWSKRPGRPYALAVVGGVTQDTLLDAIEDAEGKTPFVIVDLEGTANLLVSQALSRADLAVVPLKGSTLDAVEALKLVKFIAQQERAYRRNIPYRLLFTQTPPAIRSRTLKAIEADLLEQGIPIFGTALNDRDAYRAVFAMGGTLCTLNPEEVGGLDAARTNADRYVAEVVRALKALRSAA
jgi:chromosome partitioning protein